MSQILPTRGSCAPGPAPVAPADLDAVCTACSVLYPVPRGLQRWPKEPWRSGADPSGSGARVRAADGFDALRARARAGRGRPTRDQAGRWARLTSQTIFDALRARARAREGWERPTDDDLLSIDVNRLKRDGLLVDRSFGWVGVWGPDLGRGRGRRDQARIQRHLPRRVRGDPRPDRARVDALHVRRPAPVVSLPRLPPARREALRRSPLPLSSLRRPRLRLNPGTAALPAPAQGAEPAGAVRRRLQRHQAVPAQAEGDALADVLAAANRVRGRGTRVAACRGAAVRHRPARQP